MSELDTAPELNPTEAAHYWHVIGGLSEALDVLNNIHTSRNDQTESVGRVSDTLSEEMDTLKAIAWHGRGEYVRQADRA